MKKIIILCLIAVCVMAFISCSHNESIIKTDDIEEENVNNIQTTTTENDEKEIPENPENDVLMTESEEEAMNSFNDNETERGPNMPSTQTDAVIETQGTSEIEQEEAKQDETKPIETEPEETEPEEDAEISDSETER